MTSLDQHPALPTLAQLPNQAEAIALDGSQGTNRETPDQCQIRAINDYEAVYCWLNEYRQSQATYRSYKKEAERLVLWCIYQHNKAFSSLDTDDFKAYFAFLSNPQPQEKWCAPKGGSGNYRGSNSWKPFTGPLADSSKMTSISIIQSLLSYLVDAQYLKNNPIRLIRKKVRRQINTDVHKFNVKARILELDEWQAIINSLNNMPEEKSHQRDEKARMKFLVHILYFLGLRVSELVSHTWAAFRKEEGRWWFYVIGKGNKLGKVPVNDALIQSVREYRKHLGFTPDPEENDRHPLIVSWRTGKPVTTRFVNMLLKRLAIEAAKQFNDNPKKAEKLKHFSAHSLRHLSASMQDQVGIRFKHIRQNLRHSNDETTRIYVHALDNERHDEMNRLVLNPDGINQVD